MTKKIKISKKLAKIIDHEFRDCPEKLRSFNLCLPFQALPKELLNPKNYHVISLYLIGQELGVDFVEVEQ